MKANCRICGAALAPADTAASGKVTAGICGGCLALATADDRRAVLEAIDAPVLLMQGDPRQVVTANRKALALFGKAPSEVESHRGGEVFDCVHSFTAAGCGKDANCENCRIKDAIVDTFVTAASHRHVSTELSVKKPDGTGRYLVQVSTEKLGDLALVRVERYGAGA